MSRCCDEQSGTVPTFYSYSQPQCETSPRNCSLVLFTGEHVFRVISSHDFWSDINLSLTKTNKLFKLTDDNPVPGLQPVSYWFAVKMSIILFRADLESQSESRPHLQVEPLKQLLTSCQAKREDIQTNLERLKTSIKYQVILLLYVTYLQLRFLDWKK